jgi:hypothetical protein
LHHHRRGRWFDERRVGRVDDVADAHVELLPGQEHVGRVEQVLLLELLEREAVALGDRGERVAHLLRPPRRSVRRTVVLGAAWWRAMLPSSTACVCAGDAVAARAARRRRRRRSEQTERQARTPEVSRVSAPHRSTIQSGRNPARPLQLQPLVLPQLGQAWQLPARTICTPHCMHIGASL